MPEMSRLLQLMPSKRASTFCSLIRELNQNNNKEFTDNTIIAFVLSYQQQANDYGSKVFCTFEPTEKEEIGEMPSAGECTRA